MTDALKIKFMTDALKIKLLKQALRDCLNQVPHGWAMPISWQKAAEHAEEVLKQVK